MIADLLRLVGQVVGIDADAMAADEAGAKGQEISFAAGGFEDYEGVDGAVCGESHVLLLEGDRESALMKQLMRQLRSRKGQDRTLPASLGMRYKAVEQETLSSP